LNHEFEAWHHCQNGLQLAQVQSYCCTHISEDRLWSVVNTGSESQLCNLTCSLSLFNFVCLGYLNSSAGWMILYYIWRNNLHLRDWTWRHHVVGAGTCWQDCRFNWSIYYAWKFIYACEDSSVVLAQTVLPLIVRVPVSSYFIFPNEMYLAQDFFYCYTRHTIPELFRQAVIWMWHTTANAVSCVCFRCSYLCWNLVDMDINEWMDLVLLEIWFGAALEWNQWVEISLNHVFCDAWFLILSPEYSVTVWFIIRVLVSNFNSLKSVTVES
jgi:hypothetical protein